MALGRAIVHGAAHALAALLLAAGAAMAAPPPQPCSKALTMVTEQWPPYVYADGPAALRGLDIDLAQAIFKEAGCVLLAGPALPAARRMVLFEQGKFDLMLAASDTPERRVHARFTRAYRSETVGLYARAQDFPRYAGIGSFEALLQSDAALLAPAVGWYGAAYRLHAPELRARRRLFDYGSIEQGMRMLAARRAPLIMGDSAAVAHEAGRQRLDLRALPYVALKAPVHLMLSKASTTSADLARLDGAIVRLEKNGTLKAIIERYGLHQPLR